MTLQLTILIAICVIGAQQPEGKELIPLQWFGAQEDCWCSASS